MILLRYANAGIDNTVFEGTCSSCGAAFGAAQCEADACLTPDCTCCGAQNSVTLSRKHTSFRKHPGTEAMPRNLETASDLQEDE